MTGGVGSLFDVAARCQRPSEQIDEPLLEWADKWTCEKLQIVDCRERVILTSRQQCWVKACEIAPPWRRAGTTGGGGVAVLPLGTMEAGPRKARRGTCPSQDTKSGSGHGSEAASASTEGGKEGMAKETGETEDKKIKATEQISVNKCSVLKKHIWDLQRILDGKKGQPP